MHDGGDDWFLAFPTFESALEFSSETPYAESPLVLVSQREWIGEPEPGKYTHEKGERVTEWRVEWLDGNKRHVYSIDMFFADPLHREGSQEASTSGEPPD